MAGVGGEQLDVPGEGVLPGPGDHGEDAVVPRRGGHRHGEHGRAADLPAADLQPAVPERGQHRRAQASRAHVPSTVRQAHVEHVPRRVHRLVRPRGDAVEGVLEGVPAEEIGRGCLQVAQPLLGIGGRRCDGAPRCGAVPGPPPPAGARSPLLPRDRVLALRLSVDLAGPVVDDRRGQAEQHGDLAQQPDVVVAVHPAGSVRGEHPPRQLRRALRSGLAAEHRGGVEPGRDPGDLPQDTGGGSEGGQHGPQRRHRRVRDRGGAEREPDTRVTELLGGRREQAQLLRIGHPPPDARQLRSPAGQIRAVEHALDRVLAAALGHDTQQEPSGDRGGPRQRLRPVHGASCPVPAGRAHRRPSRQISADVVSA